MTLAPSELGRSIAQGQFNNRTLGILYDAILRAGMIEQAKVLQSDVEFRRTAQAVLAASAELDAHIAAMAEVNSRRKLRENETGERQPPLVPLQWCLAYAGALGRRASVTRPESWGRQLATIAQAISGAVGEYNDMTAEEAEALVQKGWADFWGGVN